MVNYLNLCKCENSKLGSHVDQSASSWNVDISFKLLLLEFRDDLSSSIVGFCGGKKSGRPPKWG